ncbi:hypothetical protein Nepgr_015074 [Nepenthes gracilis]|uniref:Uncharacterized protein n=1 Tax=Nepenthes gracilis TaxID=150966 RepID=A0AAD3SKM9_NEPGR|nr:hypothetical protein Nepgr_015074 [Nepenthes gracilis]
MPNGVWGATSIPHLKMKFPTPYGVGEALASVRRTVIWPVPGGNTKSVESSTIETRLPSNRRSPVKPRI